MRELASFYVPEQLPNKSDGASKRQEAEDVESTDAGNNGEDGLDEIKSRRKEIERVLEHVLFPAFRARLVATKGLLSGVVEVADLKGLYRVFERC